MKPRYEYVLGYFDSFGPRTYFTTCERVARKVSRRVGAPSYTRVGEGRRVYVSLTQARGPDAARPTRIPQRNATQRRQLRRGLARRFGR